MALFADRGFEAVSVQQIAAAAGVTAPTFYAHFAGKEQIVLPVPTEEEFVAFLALEPGDVALAERIRRLTPYWLGQFSGPEEQAALLARWRVVAATPSLRLRAGEYERTTAHTLLAALAATGATVSAADRVVVAACLAAFTATFLEWADVNGERKLEELAQEAFDALRGF